MIPRIQRSHDRNEENPSYSGFLEMHARSVYWLTILVFLTLSSVLFECLLEWDRYHVIAGPMAQVMSVSDKILLFWLLAAKSMAWFLPFLVIWGLLIASGLWRTAAVTLNIVWIVVFYFMAFDLFSVSFAGYHVWDYLPNIRDILDNPDLKIWQWAGEGLTTEAVFVLAVFVVSGPICFLSVKWVTKRLVAHFRWLVSKPALAMVTMSYIIFVLSVVAAMDLFPDRVYSTLPLSPGMRQSLEGLTEYLATRVGITHTPFTSAGFLPIRHRAAETEAQQLTLSAKAVRQDLDFPGVTMDDAVGNEDGLPGVFDPKKCEVIPTPRKMAYLNRYLQTNLNTVRFANLFDHNGERWVTRLAPDEGRNGHRASQEKMVGHQDESAATRLLRESLDPGPADPGAFVNKPGLPNVILIIFESFRHSAVGPGLMKELDAWSKQGLRLDRHYSGSNCSHLGLFSLFYGRSPLGYHQTLDRKIPAQMLESLRRSGYEITLLTSGEMKGFRRLEHFINDRSCDNVYAEGEFTLKGMKEWPDSDRRKLDHVARIVNRFQDRPQFVVFYLVSSHYRYAFPPEFEIYKEYPSIWEFLNPRAQIQNHLNRYANAALFLEHEVMKLVRSVDPSRNIIMITGDHGESMGEDGVFTHGSRMSEIQMRVPFLMVGPGVEPRTMNSATVHFDILPTLLHVLAGKSIPILNCHGRDLISDPSPADEVAVVPANGPDWDGMMIIRGDKRMIFRTVAPSGQAPEMKFDGLADESGQYELKVRRRVRHAGGANR